MVKFVEDDEDPLNADGICGHLEAVGVAQHTPSFYERFIKCGLDVILSLCGLIILSPLYALLILAIVIDDPSPVFFIQRRVGKKGFLLFTNFDP